MIATIAKRLPFFYGWVVVGVVFVTMAFGVNARTAFSLVFPPLVEEFGWERGLTAGAFSFGFLVSALLSPLMGGVMDRRGPRLVIEAGVACMGFGLLLSTAISTPLHLYLTFGLLVGFGSICMGYSAQSLFLPSWFVRKRGLAISIAFTGVGVGSIVLLPWMQAVIDRAGWRAACWTLGLAVLLLLAPLNLLLRRSPRDLGLEPDGDPRPLPGAAPRSNIVDPQWAAVDWTIRRAVRTARFWWIASGYFAGLYVWYAVQVHQTKYLNEIGFARSTAAWALGVVSLAGIPGQIALGHLSDRVGREIVWALACLGFAITYAALIALHTYPNVYLLYMMVLAQGALGYGLTSVLGAIPVEVFESRHYGTIYGTITLIALSGGAFAPWVTGVLYDRTGSYDVAWWIGIGVSVFAAFAIWRAAPRKVRAVAGRVRVAAAE